VDSLNVVQQVVLLGGRLSTEGAPEDHTGAHFVARHLSRDEFLQDTPVISFIYLSRGVVGLTVMVLSVMFLLRIVFILLLIGVERGKAGAFVWA